MIVFLGQLDHLFRQLSAAFPALGPDVGDDDINAAFLAGVIDSLQFGLGIQREFIDCHDCGQTVDILDIFQMLVQIGQTICNSLHILCGQVALGYAAVHLKGPNGGYQHDSRRPQARHPALDVNEFFSSQICSKSGFSDRIVGVFEGQLGSQHTVAAVGDIGERSAVDQGRCMLQGLYQVWMDSVFKNGCHSASGFQILSRHWLSGIVVADNNLIEPVFEVGHIL
ncbi:hypothetical protein STRDD11_00199 [Streptococcus sp. DD11]|nr:hypothetical protein STRDD11_00199 [Streptococcus sp. DD11]